jgi:Uma2 family endonuclease
VSDRGHALEAPDLAVEILSPRDDIDEQRAKCQWYLEHGTRVALLIDPEARTIETFHHGPETLAELLPGLQLDAATIFSVLDD